MKDDSTKKRYCPHLLETKLHAVEVYRKTRDISFVCRRYPLSKASLVRWNRAYDGTKNPCKRSPTNHIHLTPMPILKRNWSGFVITLVEIRTSPSVSYTENYAKKSLQPSPRLPIPRIRPPRVQEETGIHKEKIQAYRRIRYTDSPRQKVANGCEIRAKCLLFRKRRAEILSIYRHRRKRLGIDLSMRMKSKAASPSGLFQTGNWILRLRSEHSANR